MREETVEDHDREQNDDECVDIHIAVAAGALCDN
jgi:hypothetical protein